MKCGKYCAIIVISRHETKKKETVPKPRLGATTSSPSNNVHEQRNALYIIVVLNQYWYSNFAVTLLPFIDHIMFIFWGDEELPFLEGGNN